MARRGQMMAAAVLTATLTAAVSPAEARSRYHRPYYHHHDRVRAGDIIGGLLVIGAIAAVADAASKSADRRRADRDDDRRPRDDRDFDRRTGIPGPDGRSAQAVPGGNDGWWVPAAPAGDGGSNWQGDDRRAVDACTWAVEGESRAANAQIAVDRVDQRDTGLQVRGRITAVAADPAAAPGVRYFTCTYRTGRVGDVLID